MLTSEQSTGLMKSCKTVSVFPPRLAAEEQERRDFALAMRLAQVCIY